MKKRKLSKLQEIEDQYINLGYKGGKFRKALARDKEYQKFLEERKQKLTKKVKVSPTEKKKYVLSTNTDFEILKRCKQLEKSKLKKDDRFLIKLIKSQLENDWRKYLLKNLDKLMRKYKIRV